MSVSIFDNPLFALFHDPQTAAPFTAERTLALYGEVEVALTEAVAAEGLIGAAAAQRITAAIAGFEPDWEALKAASRRDGIPLPGYVRQLRDRVGAEDRAAVHFQSTSQDIMDTAQALALREVNDILDARLGALIAALDDLAERAGAAPLMGRTRMQAALPVTVGHRLATWRAPLARECARLQVLRPQVEMVEFGGPVGTREGWDGRGAQIAARMAERLGLADPGASWHTARDGLAAYAAWLSATSQALGKIGQDVALMAQQGIGEIAVAGGGSSSAMAHKQNPVAAELLVTLARYNAVQLAAAHLSALHEQERSGISWALEWMVLPAMCVTTGAGLKSALALVAAITRIGAPTEGA